MESLKSWVGKFICKIIAFVDANIKLNKIDGGVFLKSNLNFIAAALIAFCTSASSASLFYSFQNACKFFIPGYKNAAVITCDLKNYVRIYALLFSTWLLLNFMVIRRELNTIGTSKFARYFMDRKMICREYSDLMADTICMFNGLIETAWIKMNVAADFINAELSNLNFSILRSSIEFSFHAKLFNLLHQNLFLQTWLKFWFILMPFFPTRQKNEDKNSDTFCAHQFQSLFMCLNFVVDVSAPGKLFSRILYLAGRAQRVMLFLNFRREKFWEIVLDEKFN